MMYGCTLTDPADLYTAAGLGFDYIEWAGRWLTGLSEEEYRTVAGKMEALGLRAYGINAYCPAQLVIAGNGFEPDAVVRYAALCAERAAGMGAKVAGIGSPNSRRLPAGFPRKEALSQLKQFLMLTAEAFQKRDITVCLEPLAPCYCNFINTVPEAVGIVKELNREGIRTVIDFYNMEYENEADRNLRPWMEWIAHAHISDDDGGPDRRSFLKAEKKELHRNRLARLYGCGYRGAVTLEVDVRLERERAGESLAILRADGD